MSDQDKIDRARLGETRLVRRIWDQAWAHIWPNRRPATALWAMGMIEAERAINTARAEREAARLADEVAHGWCRDHQGAGAEWCVYCREQVRQGRR